MNFFQKKHTSHTKNVVVKKRIVPKNLRRTKKAKLRLSCTNFLCESRYRIIFFLSLFLYIGFIIFLVFFSSLFVVKDFDIEGDEEIAREIKKVVFVATLPTEKNFFPKERIFFLDTYEIQKLLENNFPSLRDIQVKKVFPHTIDIDFKTEEASLIGCVFSQDLLKEEISLEKEQNISLEGDEKKKEFLFDEFEKVNLELSSEERCFDVNEDGLRMGNVKKFSQENKVVLIIMDGQFPDEGEAVFDRSQIPLFIGLSQVFKENLYIDIVETIRIASSFAQDITIRTQDGWDIRMRTDIDMEENIRMLRTFLTRVVDKEEREDIRWVDIRIPKKIYYALFNQEEGEVEDSLEK